MYNSITAKKINKGDIFYEIEYGQKIKCEAITQPVKTDDQWKWKGKDLESGAVIDYLQTEGFEHYGPKLYEALASDIQNHI